MQKATKITLSIFMLIISILIGLFALLEMVQLSKMFPQDTLHMTIYSFLIIFTFVIIISLLIISIISFITYFTIKNEKSKKSVQFYITIVSLSIFVTLLILSFVLYVINIKNINILNTNMNSDLIDYYEDIYSASIELNTVFAYNIKTIILVSICNLGQLLFFLFTSNSNNTTSNIIKGEEISPRSELLKEIDEMKKELELKKIKEEYSSLYKQLHSDNN